MGNIALPAGVSAASRILCYGDSLTAGYTNGGAWFTPYASALSDALGCKVSHCGLSGHTAKQMLAEIHAARTSRDICGRSGSGLGWLLDHSERYDLVLLMAGTNDLGYGMPTETIVNNVCKLHAACHARGIPTIVLLPPSPHSLRWPLVDRLRKWARTEPNVLAVVDPEELVPRNKHQYWDSDALHLSPTGYHALGYQIASDVQAVLQPLPLAACSVPGWQYSKL